MKPEETLENSKISLKTAVLSLIVIGGWLGSLFGVYFSMLNRVEETQKIAMETKSRLDKFSPDLIVYQVNELRDQVKKSNDKADYIISLLNGNPSNGHR